MLPVGVEPTILAEHEPESCVSASCTKKATVELNYISPVPLRWKHTFITLAEGHQRLQKDSNLHVGI